jgi:hypothetical protein
MITVQVAPFIAGMALKNKPCASEGATDRVLFGNQQQLLLNEKGLYLY